MASFSTVSLMRESADVIARFAAHYAALGAEGVLVYFDGTAEEAAGLAAPGLTLIPADAVFWAAAGGRPERLEARQWAAYRLGLARCRSDWLGIVDADEFVFGDRAVGAFLDAVPAAVDSVSLPTAEAVWGPGDDIAAPFGSSYFRTPWRNARVWRLSRGLIYGDVAPFLRRGLLGHVLGKQFVRVGRDYGHVGNHDAERDGVVITRPAAALGLGGMYVGHFDAIGLERWSEKWRRRIARETVAERMAAVRLDQMAAVAAALDAGDAAALRLFRRLYGVSRMQYAVLAALGCGFRRRLF